MRNKWRARKLAISYPWDQVEKGSGKSPENLKHLPVWFPNPQTEALKRSRLAVAPGDQWGQTGILSGT